MNITGTWKLVRTSAETEDGKAAQAPFGGEHVIGRLVLDPSGRMMGAIMDARAEIPEGQKRERSFYSGRYTFDGKQLVTRVDVSIDDFYLTHAEQRALAAAHPGWWTAASRLR